MKTKEQAPWVDYLDIDEETLESVLRYDTPEDIKKKYYEKLEYEEKMIKEGKFIPR